MKKINTKKNQKKKHHYITCSYKMMVNSAFNYNLFEFFPLPYKNDILIFWKVRMLLFRLCNTIPNNEELNAHFVTNYENKFPYQPIWFWSPFYWQYRWFEHNCGCRCRRWWKLPDSTQNGNIYPWLCWTSWGILVNRILIFLLYSLTLTP